jgi:hypothetical protein
MLVRILITTQRKCKALVAFGEGGYQVITGLPGKRHNHRMVTGLCILVTCILDEEAGCLKTVSY